MNDFSLRLVGILKQRGISSHQLAKEINISRATISNYINGKTKPKNLILEKLSDYLGLSKDWLLKGEGEMMANKMARRRKISSFSTHEIATYIIDNEATFKNNALFKAYLEVLVAKRNAAIAKQAYLHAQDEREEGNRKDPPSEPSKSI